jgi:hypothetical protein
LSIVPKCEMMDVERWHGLYLTSIQDHETWNIMRSQDSQKPQKAGSIHLQPYIQNLIKLLKFEGMIEDSIGGIILRKFLSIVPKCEMMDMERWHRLDLTSRWDRETKNITRSQDSEDIRYHHLHPTYCMGLIRYWSSKVYISRYWWNRCR